MSLKNEVEKTKFGDATVYLRLISPEEYEKMGFPNPTSIHCFPVENEKVWVTENPRGIDIIGGHVEGNETIVETLLRETMEESCIKLNTYKMLGVVEVDNSENPKGIEKYGVKGYQVFFVSYDFELKHFEQTHECVGRKLICKNDLQNQHHHWLLTHQNLISKIKSKGELFMEGYEKVSEKVSEFLKKIKENQSEEFLLKEVSVLSKDLRVFDSEQLAFGLDLLKSGLRKYDSCVDEHKVLNYDLSNKIAKILSQDNPVNMLVIVEFFNEGGTRLDRKSRKNK